MEGGRWLGIFGGGPALNLRDQTKETDPVDLRPGHAAVNTKTGPLIGVIGVSSAWWYFYAVTSRRTEWVDVMLDYCHHKRTQYNPSNLDKLGRNFIQFCMRAPK